MYFRRFFSKKYLFLSLIFAFFFQTTVSRAEGENKSQAEGSGFNVKAVTDEHLLDSYEWEFFKHEDGTPVKIDLPRIIWNKQEGKLHFFASTDEAIEQGHYVRADEFDKAHENGLPGALLVPGADEHLRSLEAEVEHAPDPTARAERQKALDSAMSEYAVLDFSITKNVVLIFIASILLLLVFTSVAKGYKKNAGRAPRGIQSFFEPIVVFIRDEIAKENIGPKYERFMPLLLTMFFFIWFLNLLGMMPFSGNVTGNISVTLTLALVTLVVVNLSASKSYWKHILWPPVPHGIKPIMVPLEILSIFTKPFALTIRLFANISGGHIIMISLLSLIFIFGESGQKAMAGWSVGIFSSLFIVAISLLELFVALLQAYVFTLLTAVFLGQAVVEEEHH